MVKSASMRLHFPLLFRKRRGWDCHKMSPPLSIFSYLVDESDPILARVDIQDPDSLCVWLSGQGMMYWRGGLRLELTGGSKGEEEEEEEEGL